MVGTALPTARSTPRLFQTVFAGRSPGHTYTISSTQRFIVMTDLFGVSPPYAGFELCGSEWRSQVEAGQHQQFHQT